MRRLFELRKDERGATAVEYGLILALIFLAMVGAVCDLRQHDHDDVERCVDQGPELVRRIKSLATSISYCRS